MLVFPDPHGIGCLCADTKWGCARIPSPRTTGICEMVGCCLPFDDHRIVNSTLICPKDFPPAKGDIEDSLDEGVAQ